VKTLIIGTFMMISMTLATNNEAINPQTMSGCSETAAAPA